MNLPSSSLVPTSPPSSLPLNHHHHHHPHQNSSFRINSYVTGIVFFVLVVACLTMFQFSSSTSSPTSISSKSSIQHNQHVPRSPPSSPSDAVLSSKTSQQGQRGNSGKKSSSIASSLSSLTSTLGTSTLGKCRSGIVQYNRHFLNGNLKRGWFGPRKGIILLPGLKSIQDLAKALKSADSAAVAGGGGSSSASPIEQEHQQIFVQSLNAQTNFQNLFDIEYRRGNLKIPNHMKKQASDMFSQYKKMNHRRGSNGGDDADDNNNNEDDDVSHIESQHVVLSTNKVTNEQALFNELRKYRPGALRHLSAEEDERINAKYLEREGADKCDFCARNKTAVDVFGRIDGKHCYTASNIAKLCEWHGLIINNRHDAIHSTREEVRDWMVVARQWFRKAHELDRAARFPHLMYDAGTRASASQPHLHLQTMLTKTMYFTHAKNLLDRAYQYSYCLNGGLRDYWRDWIKAHEAVGLALHHDGSWLVVSLTPVHDKEIFVIGNSGAASFATLLHFAMNRVYVESKLQVRSFSMGMFLEKMGDVESSRSSSSSDEFSKRHNNNNNINSDNFYPNDENMPAVARMMDRGSPFDVRSDVGAMEFYGAFNVGTDPFFIMEQVNAAAKEAGLVV